MAQLERVRTSTLGVAYEHAGAPDAFPIVLMHGFPYDPRAFDEAVLDFLADLSQQTGYARSPGRSVAATCRIGLSI